jgi:hypothetical protein
VSKGHSMRGGRSRCTSKVGPHARAHQSKAIQRRDSIKAAEEGHPVPQRQPMPNLRRGVSPLAALPPETAARPVLEPVVSLRHFADRVVEIHDSRR